MREAWRPIPGFSGYEVSDQGRVRSYRRSPVPRLMAIHGDGRGYMRLALWDGTREVPKRVHQLVALAFIGPCPQGFEVRHLDGNGSNNVPSNLDYATSSVNQFDKVRHGTHNMARKTHCDKGHEFTDENTFVVTLRTGSQARQCRTCNRLRAARYRATKRQVAS